MGAKPRWLLCSVVVPRSMSAADLWELLRGVRGAAAAAPAAVIGGDVAVSDGPLSVHISAFGCAPRRRCGATSSRSETRCTSRTRSAARSRPPSAVSPGASRRRVVGESGRGACSDGRQRWARDRPRNDAAGERRPRRGARRTRDPDRAAARRWLAATARRRCGWRCMTRKITACCLASAAAGAWAMEARSPRGRAVPSVGSSRSLAYRCAQAAACGGAVDGYQHEVGQ